MADAAARMLDAIAADAADTARLTGRPRLSEATLRAMAAVPRERFVPVIEASAAYLNRPLPIGHGQTISQPFVVALMTDLLDIAPGDKVLEIGTGSGYQAAVLAEAGARVFSVETVPELARRAAETLTATGYESVRTREGDGYKGWPEEAPFDAVIVTAAPVEIPEALAKQMSPGARLVIPVGRRGDAQTLFRCVKRADGKLDCANVLPVAFVPMVKEKPEDKRRHLWS